MRRILIGKLAKFNAGCQMTPNSNYIKQRIKIINRQNDSKTNIRALRLSFNPNLKYYTYTITVHYYYREKWYANNGYKCQNKAFALIQFKHGIITI